SAISPAPADEWRLGAHVDRARLAREIASDAGGYVRGFDSVFDASGFLVPAARLTGLDPVFLWTFHAAREALRSAGLELARRPDGVLILGNLSYPTPGLVDLVEEAWLPPAPKSSDSRNRFMSGLPALLAAEAVGFGGGAFALDAACASSLYAIKLACDRLEDGSASIALAGGVNDVDDFFCHLGFTALGALSPTGSSRPFHRRADGLVPARGAAFVVLERLRDAEAAGRPVLGVIRGVGLSNDGRSRGLLVPSEDGQVRAMRAAYAVSGVSPADVSLVECHATGIVVGDAVELRSMRAVFEGCRDVPIGSLKSNLGHLVTASGIASLLKVLAAMGAGMRPPTLHVDEPLDAGPLRLLDALEPWPSDRPRLAAVSNFGFGGNNAHLVVEEWSGPSGARARSHSSSDDRIAPDGDIAIVAMSVTAGAADSIEAFDECLFTGRSVVGADGAVAADFEMDVSESRFPPADLEESLAQQTMLLRAALELKTAISTLNPERTSIFVGMQCDAEIPRRCLHFRNGRAAEGAPVTAASALGCMPNIVANRLSHQLDLRAPSFTVSAEEASGIVALELAARSLRSHEIDAALVAAVDLACEAVQRAAAVANLPAHHRVPGDAAVMLVCKRVADARRDGNSILAVLGTSTDGGTPLRLDAESGWLAFLFGHAHAASGLLHVAAAVRCCDRRAQPAHGPGPEKPWLPTAGTRRVEVVVDAFAGGRSTTSLRTEPESSPGRSAHSGVRFAVFTARSVDGLVRALDAPDESEEASDGDYRLAIVASGDAELAERIERARTLLRTHRSASSALSDEGIYFGAGPMRGELAFVFTGPAGAYPHMGRELALTLPELVDRLGEKASRLLDEARWIYEEDPTYRATPAQKLSGASFLTQLHAELTRGLLAVRPDAAVGYCSGETNALFALGAWTDANGFMRAVDESGVYTRELGGELRAVQRAWEVLNGESVAWSARRVRAPIDEVRAAIATERRVHVTIVNTPNDVVIAGDPSGLSRVADRLGAQRLRSLDFDFVMHCPEARAYETGWRALHVRPVTAVPNVRFYTHATL
ncbi:MAG TPA: beta-ketoacyl synthase N-terminal-like domain-containing protein, partial [Polyangiaceae bacterium]